MIKFSIGIPAYKGKFLKECIESVLSQTYSNYDLIIVNDCSPEPLENIVNQFIDNRILYHKNHKNIGAINVVDNWNKCLQFSDSDYFILLGDDDKLATNYLDSFKKLIEKFPGLDIYHCRSLIIDESSNVSNITPNNPDYEDLYDFLLNCLEGRNQQFISDFVYKTSTLKQNGGFYKVPLAYGSDYLSAYIACGMKGIAHTNEPLLYYRIHNDNITATGNIDAKWEAYQMLDKQIKLLIVEKGDNYITELKRQLVKGAIRRKWNIERESIVIQMLGGKDKIKKILKMDKKRKQFSINRMGIIKIAIKQFTYNYLYSNVK